MALPPRRDSSQTPVRKDHSCQPCGHQPRGSSSPRTRPQRSLSGVCPLFLMAQHVAPKLPLPPSLATRLTPLLLDVLSPGAGATVATRIKKQVIMGLGLAASASSRPEPLLSSPATLHSRLCGCVPMYCLQSYMQGATLHLPGNNAADTGNGHGGPQPRACPSHSPQGGS